MNKKQLWKLCREAFNEWREDKAPRLGAALAYYTVFSLAPLLLLLIWLLGLFVSTPDVQQRIIGQFSQLLGPETSSAISDLMSSAAQSGARSMASVFGFVLLLVGATGVFGQLQDALDTVWGVTRTSRSGMWGIIRERWLSLLMVLGIGFLLLVSLVFSAVLGFAQGYLSSYLPFPAFVAEILHFVLAGLITTLLFALIYKLLPNVYVPWRCVWMGTLLAGIAFTIGKTLIGLYLGHSSISSAYGAAGSLVIILVWTYYSAQILLFGAEYTEVYAHHLRLPLKPKKGFEFKERSMNRHHGPNLSEGLRSPLVGAAPTGSQREGTIHHLRCYDSTRSKI